MENTLNRTMPRYFFFKMFKKIGVGVILRLTLFIRHIHVFVIPYKSVSFENKFDLDIQKNIGRNLRNLIELHQDVEI